MGGRDAFECAFLLDEPDDEWWSPIRSRRKLRASALRLVLKLKPSARV